MRATIAGSGYSSPTSHRRGCSRDQLVLNGSTALERAQFGNTVRSLDTLNLPDTHIEDVRFYRYQRISARDRKSVV